MTILRGLALLCVVFGAPAFAEEGKPPPWANNPDYKRLVKDEVKQLNRLLTEALDEDYRRQAVYFARRIVALEPDDKRAAATLAQWSGLAKFDTPAPKDKYFKKLDGTMRKLGDAWFHFGEVLEAQGVDPEIYYPINIRALRYGSQAGPLVTSIRQAGQYWMSTFNHHPTKKVKEMLGSAMYELSFPPEWDDDFLKVNVHWPESQVAVLRQWRLITDGSHEKALKLLRALDELERYVLDRMGGKAPKKGEPTNVVVCTKGETYEALVKALLSDRVQDQAMNTSAYYSRWRQIALACWEHRENKKWIKGEALALGAAARAIARTHLAPKSRGSVRGKGAWLFDGLAGAFEALDWSDPGFTEINPRACWRLAAARALRDKQKLLDWDEFLALDAAKAEAVDRVSLTIKLKGRSREAKNTDVIAAQATAFVVGLMTADKKRGPKRVGKLIQDLIKRDSLPNVDKAMGWKKGRAVQEAERVLDDAGG